MTVEILEGRGVGAENDHIYLHLEHLGADLLHQRLPGITETSKIFAGVDASKEPIPVLPTVHYNMGGIPTNYHGEVLRPTEADPDAVCPGLMAIGEAACVSVHGANRLGTNSLLDLIVFGRAAAIKAAEDIKPNTAHKRVPPDAVDFAIGRFDGLRHASGSIKTATIRLEMQRVMQSHAAVFRTDKTLVEGCNKLKDVVAKMPDLQVNDRSLIWNSDLVETIEFENLMACSLTAMFSAEARKESRGAHAREDFAERDDVNWMKHSLAWVDDKNQVTLGYRPVHKYTLTDEVSYIEPAKRVY
jgi:succinate dehydrogenase / fumarate reductase flavoprotein subunit